MYIRSSYLAPVLDKTQFPKLIQKAVDVLSGVEFDAIAIRGNSGALFGGALSLRMDKALWLVRKDMDNAHSGYILEGDIHAERFIILDDLVATGITVRNIYQNVMRFHPTPSKLELMGLYTYLPNSSYNTVTPQVLIPPTDSQLARLISNIDSITIKA